MSSQRNISTWFPTQYSTAQDQLNYSHNNWYHYSGEHLANVKAEDSKFQPENSLSQFERGDEDSANTPIILALFIVCRKNQFEPLNLSETDLLALLEGQHHLRQSHYRNAFPGSQRLVVTKRESCIGRLYLHEGEADVRILDISILPSFRNRGFGTELIRWVLFRAAELNRTAGLHVQTTNPAVRLYSRLGFAPDSVSSAPGLPMTWRCETGRT